MKIKEIIANYGLREEVAIYLSHVTKSKDFREYENYKRGLQKLCNTSKEYGRAIKCLTDVMGI